MEWKYLPFNEPSFPKFFPICTDKKDMQSGTKNLCVWHVKSKCDPAPTLQ